jgi:hypothetical protein
MTAVTPAETPRAQALRATVFGLPASSPQPALALALRTGTA